MKYIAHQLLASLLFLAGAVGATEIDNITSYYTPIADSENILNHNVQDKIDIALSRTAGCRRGTLARAAASQLVGNIIFGTVEAFANNSDDVDRDFTAVQASVYRHTTYQGGMIDSFVNLGPTVNVSGVHIGTDKIGHFFAMGYNLYTNERFGRSVDTLVAYSRREETGLWGLLTTGVKSYGDIASNFDGYRFWKEFVDEGPGQYFVCEQGKLKQTRPFRWSDYVNPAWNEAINCNGYWSEDFGRQVAANISRLESKHGRRFTCPIDPALCPGLRARYSRWIPEGLVNELISPLCR